tara:strand:+ start:539 stop:1183 length:645 start_codon:yes stop_codon:yes gene_type:complete
MIKILSLLSITSVFFIVFINVKNLTPVNENFTQQIYSDKIQSKKFNVLEKNQIDKIEEEILQKKNKNLIDSKEKIVEEQTEILDKSISNPNHKEEANSSDEKEYKSNQPTNKKLTNSKVDKVENELSTDKLAKLNERIITIQFGAFSKMTNAESHMKKVSEAVSKEFPEFKNNLKILEENKLFKILMLTESDLKAKSICDYSKSKKISCLVLIK